MKNSIKREKWSAFFCHGFLSCSQQHPCCRRPESYLFSLITFCRAIRLAGVLCHLCQSENCVLAYNLVGKPSPAPYFSFLPLLFMCLSSNGKKTHSRLGWLALLTLIGFVASIFTVLKTKSCNILTTNSARHYKTKEKLFFCILYDN